MTALAGICLLLAALGSLYMLAAALLVAHFARRSAADEAELPAAPPAVTILKPLHGEEPRLFDNLASFCRQDYPGPVQIVLGVQNRADPALRAAERLVAAFPGRDIALVVDATSHGSNGKVSNLVNMSRAIRHDLIVLSDSDIRVEPGYLSGIVAELARPGVGAVTCLYHGEPAAGTAWARLSALAINGQFLPNAVVATTLRLAAPCFGATIALRRQTLAALGGFEAFADDLADDHALGLALRRAGHPVAIPRRTVAHSCADARARDLWRRELRWGRTIRNLHPGRYAATVVGYPVPFALLALGFSGLDPVAGVALSTALAARILVCAAVDRVFGLAPHRFWLVPLRDLLSFAAFLWSFAPGGVSWRGHRFQVLSDGTLVSTGRSGLP